jgi:hypothetical protein
MQRRCTLKHNYNVGVRILLAIADVFLIVLAGLAAYWADIHAFSVSNEAWLWILANIVITIAIYTIAGLYSMVFSSIGILDGIRITFSVMVVGGINVIFAAVLGRNHHLGFSVAFVFTVFLYFGTLYALYINIKIKFLWRLEFCAEKTY